MDASALRMDGGVAHQRARGAVEIAVGPDAAGVSRLRRLRHGGSAKCLLPKTEEPAPLGVLINTAGGLAGGDHFTVAAAVEAGGRLGVTSQAAERVYRAHEGAAARVENRLTIGAGARLDWLPQETILFDGGRLERGLKVEMAADSAFLGFEMITLGRAAMGETVSDGFLSDQWRVRRGGELVFAEALRLAAPIDAQMAAPATGAGALAMAMLLYVGPDAEDRLDATRAHIRAASPESGLDAGASAWNGLLCVRLIGARAAPLRQAAARLIDHFRGFPPPRFWSL